MKKIQNEMAQSKVTKNNRNRRGSDGSILPDVSSTTSQKAEETAEHMVSLDDEDDYLHAGVRLERSHPELELDMNYNIDDEGPTSCYQLINLKYHHTKQRCIIV